VAEKFISGEVQRVELIYTEFISLGSQRVAVRRFLPLESTTTVATAGHGQSELVAAAEFEPSAPDCWPRCCRAMSKLVCSVPCWKARLRARQPPAGHESRDRQCRRVADQADAPDEPRASRRDHYRIMEIVSGAEALRAEDAEALIELAET
jgi:F-type H+-transporting ATPase subunit gamma